MLGLLGVVLDLAEVAATPLLIEGCVKGIEKEGKAEFKVFGKKHTLSMGMPCLFLQNNVNLANSRECSDEPSKLPETRPPASSHSPEPTSSACNKRVRDCRRTSTVTEAKQPIATICEPHCSTTV